MNIYKTILLSVSIFSLSLSVSADENIDAKKLFKQKCTLCHAIDKKKLGPAVKVMSKDAKVLHQIISKGKKSMPAYGGKLSAVQMDALVNYLLASQ